MDKLQTTTISATTISWHHKYNEVLQQQCLRERNDAQVSVTGSNHKDQILSFHPNKQVRAMLSARSWRKNIAIVRYNSLGSDLVLSPELVTGYSGSTTKIEVNHMWSPPHFRDPATTCIGLKIPPSSLHYHIVGIKPSFTYCITLLKAN